MSNETDPWEDGELAEAFGVQNEKTATKNELNENNDEEENFALENGRYPIRNKQEAVESIKRAMNNEDSDTFKKIANRVTNIHPEIAVDGSIEKTAELGYKLGENIARGLMDNISN